MMPARNHWLAGILALVWVMGGVAYYFVNHKPISPSTALILGKGIFNFLVASLVTALAGGLGRGARKAIFTRDSPLEERQRSPSVWEMYQGKEAIPPNPVVLLVLEAAIGLGILGPGVLIVGSTVGISPVVAWGAVLILSLGLRHHLIKWLRQWKDLGRSLKGADRLTISLVVGLGLIFFLTLLMALAPPLKFDALVYHLAIPKLYLEHGRISYIAGNMFWGMPQTVEMLYTWVMALAGVPAAVAFGWIIAALAVIGLVGLVRQVYDPALGWVAGAILMGGYSLAISTAWGYVDWAVFLFGFGFLVWLNAWRTAGRTPDLLLAGLMAGMALGTKYTAGLLMVIGAVLIVVGSQERKKAGGRLIVFWALATVVVLPWWGRNFLATGNPFYPLIFPGGEMDPVRLMFYQDHAPWGNWLDVVLLPLRATFLGLEGNPGYGTSIGPFLFMVGILAFFGWRSWPDHERGMIETAGGIAGVGILVWIVASRSSGLLTQTRLYLAIFPAVTLLAAAGVQRISQLKVPEVRVGRIVRILIGVVLWLNVLQVAGRVLQTGAPRYHFGLVGEGQYLEDNLGWYARVMEAIRALPEGGRVLLLWEPRGYYCEPICEPDEVLDRWVHELRTQSDTGTIVDFWVQEGFSHFLVYRAGADFIREDDPRYEAAEWEAFESLLARSVLIEEFGGTYELYRLQP